MFNNSIGIQYNWREGESYPLKDKLWKAASSRINIPAVTDPADFLANFTTADAGFLATLRADARYPY